MTTKYHCAFGRWLLPLAWIAVAGSGCQAPDLGHFESKPKPAPPSSIKAVEEAAFRGGQIAAAVAADAEMFPDIPRDNVMEKYFSFLSKVKTSLVNESSIARSPRSTLLHILAHMKASGMRAEGVEGERNWRESGGTISSLLLSGRGTCASFTYLATAVMRDLGYYGVGSVCMPEHSALAVQDTSRMYSTDSGRWSYFEATTFGTKYQPDKVFGQTIEQVSKGAGRGLHYGRVLNKEQEIAHYVLDQLGHWIKLPEKDKVSLEAIAWGKAQLGGTCITLELNIALRELRYLESIGDSSQAELNRGVEAIRRCFETLRTFHSADTGYIIKYADVLRKLRQIDLCIEVLENYLASNPSVESMAQKVIHTLYWVERSRTEGSHRLKDSEEVKRALKWLKDNFPQEEGRFPEVQQAIDSLILRSRQVPEK